MEEKEKTPGTFSKYLHSFFPDANKSKQDTSVKAEISEKTSVFNLCSEVLQIQGTMKDKKEGSFPVNVSKPAREAVEVDYSSRAIKKKHLLTDDMWGNDFPEDFSEDCIVENESEKKNREEYSLKQSKSVGILSSWPQETSKEASNMIVPLSSEDCDNQSVNVKNLNEMGSIPVIQIPSFSSVSESQIQKTAMNPSAKSLPSSFSSQAFTMDWLRNQLEKVNKECNSLKDSLRVKEGESSLLREKLHDTELEAQKVKQQWLTASAKERINFEEKIKELQKQLNNAKTQILFKSKEVESNLERYLELKSLSIKEPEFTQVKSSLSYSFKKFISTGEHQQLQETSKGSYSCDPLRKVSIAKKETQISPKKNAGNKIQNFSTKFEIGKELEFLVHPDLFIESELELNFVIPPSTDYYPFNVMYKDIREMPTDDFSNITGLNLYNIWKVKREPFSEIMSKVVNLTSDSDSDSDLQCSTDPQSTVNKNTSENSHFPHLLPLHCLEGDKISENQRYSETSSGSQGKLLLSSTLPQKEKGSHPRLLFLGKSRYFTTLREIYLPLIEMCKSSSWKNRVIEEVIKHITTMTRELYIAMCDPSIDSYYSTMHRRDNQIIDSCSDFSELNLEYNIFSPKKWREKEIFVDLRRGVALIKVLCDLNHGCMELVLNTSVNEHCSKLHFKSTENMEHTQKAPKKKIYSCHKHTQKSFPKAMKQTKSKQSNKETKQVTREMQRLPHEIVKKVDEERCHECHRIKKPEAGVSKQGIKARRTCLIELDESCSWRFSEDDVLLNENRMNIDENEPMDLKIKIVYPDDFIERNRISAVEFSNGTMDQITDKLIDNTIGERPKIYQPFVISADEPSKIVGACSLKSQDINYPVNEPNTAINNEIVMIKKKFDEHLNKKINESLILLTNFAEEDNANIEHQESISKEGEEAHFSVMDKITKNEQLQWVEAINSCLLSVSEKSSTKDIMVLREGTCISEAEKIFLTRALSTFNKIKLNMKREQVIKEDIGKKRRLSEDISGSSKKAALTVNYKEGTLGNDSSAMEMDQKLLSENSKSSVSNFSYRKKRDLRPLRKSLKDDVLPGTSKDDVNLDKEIEMEIQKIFNKQTEVKPQKKRKDKTKDIDLLNCDDVNKTDRFYYFNLLAHSGGFLTLLFELIREIGRKRYTINFNFLFAVIINLIHTLLKNGNPGPIQRHFLFDILQEILYCRPSPIALLQMNKLLIDVISCHPFFTSLMCHNANSSHMVIESETAFFTRGACFIEVMCSLIDCFVDKTDWEIQTYCIRWVSYMYLVEKTTIEEWYSTQKTACRRCQCIVLLTNMSVKIFEMASSYYLMCCIENKLSDLLSCQLLEIMQSGVKVLYVMIDFDKHFSENIGERYSMFLRFLDTVKLIHRNSEQFKEFNDNNKDLDIVQLLLIEEKVVGNITKTSSASQTINETSELFSKETEWPPNTFLCDKLFLSDISGCEELSD